MSGTDLILRHDPIGTMSYGYFVCQDCGSSMYGGGPFFHRKTCTREGYAGLEYVMGDKAIFSVLQGRGSLNPVTAEDIRRQLPEVVARIEAAALLPRSPSHPAY